MTTHDADYWREQYARAVARAERLQAEVERLRAEATGGTCEGCGQTCPASCGLCDPCASALTEANERLLADTIAERDEAIRERDEARAETLAWAAEQVRGSYCPSLGDMARLADRIAAGPRLTQTFS